MGRAVLAIEVVLVADENDGELLVGVVLGLLEPLGKVVEGGAAGGVVHEDGGDRPAVV